MRITELIYSFIDSIFFDEKCIRCGQKQKLLCRDCLNTLPRPENDLPDYIQALYEYRNSTVKKLLTDAKYRKRFAGLKVFGRVMADAVIDISSEYTELNNYSKIILIPVPISKNRYRVRGFNQAEILTKEILTNLKDPIYFLGKNIVIKTKDPVPQASIKNRNERLNSPINTFKVINPEILSGALCIVIDDITTTGGTIKEMRRNLLDSGALDVIGLTIAH